MKILTVAKQRLFDNCKQSLLANLNTSSKCTIYEYLIHHCSLQPYLTKIFFYNIRNLHKLRWSSRWLAVEIGWYNNVPLQGRLNMYSKIEMSLLLSFKRKKIRLKFYYFKPVVFKLIQLLASQNVKELCNLGRLIKNVEFCQQKASCVMLLSF